MTSLRVAYLCGEYPRATDTFIQREIDGLRKAGVHVATISVRRPAIQEQGSDEQQREREQTHYLIPCSPWRLIISHLRVFVSSPRRYLNGIWLALTVRSPGLRALIYQLFYFAEAGLVAAHMKRNDIRHVHNHAPDASGYVTMIAAHLGDFTYSMTLHGFGILSEPRRWRLKEKLERCLFAICVSWHARSQAMLWSDVSCWDRYHVIHCGVDSDRFTLREHAGRGNRLLYVGRFDHVKGLPLLLEAIAELAASREDIHLDIVGDGLLRPQIEAIVETRGLQKHVTLHGYLSQAQLCELQQRADVCVLTSLAEGLPVVLIEAMAAGLPVVAPRITGIPELVDDGVNGALFTPGQTDDLVRAIAVLLDDPEQRRQFGRAGRRTVEHNFDLASEVARLVQVFQQRLNGETEQVRPDDATVAAQTARLENHGAATPSVRNEPLSSSA